MYVAGRHRLVASPTHKEIVSPSRDYIGSRVFPHALSWRPLFPRLGFLSRACLFMPPAVRPSLLTIFCKFSGFALRYFLGFEAIIASKIVIAFLPTYSGSFAHAMKSASRPRLAGGSNSLGRPLGVRSKRYVATATSTSYQSEAFR